MKRKVSLFFTIFLGMILLFTIKSNASFSSNDPTVKSGESISISVSSSENVQNFEIALSSYSGLKFNGCSHSSESAVVNSAGGKIAYASAGKGTTSLGNFSFTAPTVTTETKYKVTFTIDGSITNTATVTVKPQETKPDNNTSNNGNTNNNTNNNANATENKKSSNANLSNLGIRPNDFSGFKPGKYTYDVEVPYETESIEVYANKSENAQEISGTGTKKLNEGSNQVQVTVKAEDGTKKTYTINITRKAKTDTTSEETEDPMGDGFGLSELRITDNKIEPTFSTDVYEYKLDLKENTKKLEVIATATETEANIEITGNENLQDGDNTIKIVVTNADKTKTATYEILVNNPTLEENTKEEENTSLIMARTENKTKANRNKMLLSLILVSIFIAIIILIVLRIRTVKNETTPVGAIPFTTLMSDDDYENYEDDTQEDMEEYEQDEEDDLTEENEESNDYDSYEEITPAKKKHNKGKRFK